MRKIETKSVAYEYNRYDFLYWLSEVLEIILSIDASMKTDLI